MCPALLVYLASRLMDTVGLAAMEDVYSKAMLFFRKDVTITFSHEAPSSCSSVTHLGLQKSTACNQQLGCSHGQKHRVRSRQVLVCLEPRVHLYPVCFATLYPKCLSNVSANLAISL